METAITGWGSVGEQATARTRRKWADARSAVKRPAHSPGAFSRPKRPHLLWSARWAQPGTIGVERLTLRIRRITFSSPPAGLLVPETVSRLREVVTEMSEDPEVHVAVFTSSTPGFFFNHFDLGQADGFGAPSDTEVTSAWVDPVVRPTQGSVHQDRVHRRVVHPRPDQGRRGTR